MRHCLFLRVNGQSCDVNVVTYVSFLQGNVTYLTANNVQWAQQLSARCVTETTNSPPVEVVVSMSKIEPVLSDHLIMWSLETSDLSWQEE